MTQAKNYSTFFVLALTVTVVVGRTTLVDNIFPQNRKTERALLQLGERVGSWEAPADFVPQDATCQRQGQFPFTVSIRDKTTEKEHICGGVLIAKNAVLTAAHCVDPRTSTKATITPDLHIGGTNSDRPIEIRETVRGFPHPEWTGSIEDGSNLIILKLNETTCVEPIPILGAKDAADRANLTFIGFGRTTMGGSFTVQQRVALFNTFNNTHCNSRYGMDPPLGDSTLCTRGRTNIGVCNGDEGSPLFRQPTILRRKDFLVGIASFTTAECTETEGAAIFTNIDKYSKWIKKLLKSKEFKEA